MPLTTTLENNKTAHSRQDATAEPAHPTDMQCARRRLRIPIILLLLAAVFYCAATYSIARAKEPFTDEGWFACPAYNLAFHGFMGSTVMEPTGTWLTSELKGIHEYTYLVMPLDLVVLAGWFKILGFGLVQMRLLSAVWGVIALASWFFIVERITRNAAAGCLAVFLLACDFTFLWSAADGRMDMMCVALGSAALAAYLTLRERNFRLGLLASNGLAAASVFTHPNGVAWVLMLAMLVFLNDRQKLRLSHLSTLSPFALFGACWGAYIAKHPDYFWAQFSANMNPPGGSRGFGLLHPGWSLTLEWYRYRGHFGDALWAAPVPRWAIFIPFLLWTIVVAAGIRWLRTRDRSLGTILGLLLLCLLFMTFGDSLKAENYLGMIMPIYAATAAIWFFAAFRSDSKWLWLRGGLLAVVLLFQIAVLATKLERNPLRDEYAPTVAFLQSMPNARIIGDSVFGFDLGYDRLTDDLRLAMLSRPQPELIVVDRWYLYGWLMILQGTDRPALAHVRDVLRQYHPVFLRGTYIVYQRNDWSPAAPSQ